MDYPVVRKLTYALIISMLTVLFTGAAATAATTELVTNKIYIDDEQVSFSNEPFVEKMTTLVEFRAIFERLGFYVDYDSQAVAAIATKGDTRIVFPIGKAEAVVNGITKPLLVKTRIINGRTFIPLTFIRDESGYEVEYDLKSNAVFIYTHKVNEFSLDSMESDNGMIHLTGRTESNVAYVRLVIENGSKPDEIESVQLVPSDTGIVDSDIYLKSGSGQYSIEIYLAANTMGASSKPIQTLNVSNSADSGLTLLADANDKNQYMVKGMLSPGMKRALLYIERLDSESFMSVMIHKDGNEPVKKKFYLPFGTGTYNISIYESNQDDDGNGNFDSFGFAKMVTINHKGDSGLKLSALHTENSQIELQGKVSPEMKWLWIRYANVDKGLIRNAFVPVDKGRVEHTLQLNLGSGTYDVAFELTDQENPYRDYVTKETVKIKNEDSRNPYLLPSEVIESDEPEIVQLAEQITDGLLTDAEKSQAIHDWVGRNIAYDAATFLAGEDRDDSALQTLHGRISDCTGFVRLNAALHRAAGIPAKVIMGATLSEDKSWDDIDKETITHAWNEVYYGDQWVIQDPTWDAGYIDNRTGKFVSKLVHTYFNPDSKQFAEDHYEIMEIKE